MTAIPSRARTSRTVDLAPLRESGGFRWLICGQAFSVFGTSIIQVTVPVQIFEATHSAFLVGLVGLAGFVPLLVSSVLGGAAADLHDRRTLLVVTAACCAMVAAALALQAGLDRNEIVGLFLAAAAHATVLATDTPTRRAAMPVLLEPRHYVTANTLLFGVNNVGTIGAPLIGGVVVASLGFSASYAVSGVCYLGVILAALRLPRMPATERTGERAGLGMRATVEGFRFLWRQPVLLTAMLADFFATVFAVRRALFPVFAFEVFHGGVHTTTLLYAAPAVGSLVAVATGGWWGRIRRLGRGVVVALTVWGASTIAFGVSTALWFALLMLVVGGAADAVNTVFRASIMQLITPPGMQGRMSGAYTTFANGGPRLGDLEAGSVASFAGPAVSATSGGAICCVIAALVCLLSPRFLRWRAPA